MDSTVLGILQARILERIAFPFSRGSSQPRSPALQADSLPAEPQNTGAGSLSLLQGIFPTQESNWGLLHCRRILYQLIYQGRMSQNKMKCIFDFPRERFQRRRWHPTPVLLLGKSHGQRSVVGCSPGVAKSWTRLSDFTFMH